MKYYFSIFLPLKNAKTILAQGLHKNREWARPVHPTLRESTASQAQSFTSNLRLFCHIMYSLFIIYL